MPTAKLESGLALSYREQDDVDGLPVVFVPGPTDAWRSYQPVLDRLPRVIRAIAVSQRGHGASDKPESGYRVEDFAGDVLALLDVLGIERAVLAGHSGSCLVVRRAALDHPDRVAGLVLEASPTTLVDNANLIEFIESVVANLIDSIDPELARWFVTGTSSENLPPELVEALVEDMLAVPARVWKETFAGLLEYDDVAELSMMEAPTLLVWGDADGLVSRGMQDQLASTIPNAELAVYEGIGHTPRWEQPARFADDVTRFVRQIVDRS
jgi:pimeloyl-ACP methyl ester carboxylesterase